MTSERRPCPYLDRNDGRCSRFLSLVHLPEAFCYCLAQPESCSVYRQIRREEKARDHVPAYAHSA